MTDTKTEGLTREECLNLIGLLAGYKTLVEREISERERPVDEDTLSYLVYSTIVERRDLIEQLLNRLREYYHQQ